MTVYCERDTQKPGNVCIKCGGTWVAGTPLPACSVANALPSLDNPATTADEIAAADGVTQSWQMPRSVLLDPEMRALAPDEPFFILRGSDLLADYLVELWARNAETNGCDPKKVAAAREKAREMRAYSPRRYPV